MEIPFSSAAKRGDVFIAVPITVALPLPPHCSIYFREIGPLSARDPAKARPKPSRIDFFPSSMTSAGIFSYLVCRTNCPTYCVNPGVLGKSTAGAAVATAAPSASSAAEGAESNVAPSTPKDVLPNSRLRIIHLEPGHLRLDLVDAHFRVLARVMRHAQIIAIPLRHQNTSLRAECSRNLGQELVVVCIFLLEYFERPVAREI